MSIDQIQAQIDAKNTELATLKRALNEAKRAQAPVCKCGAVLWNSRGYCQFVAVEVTSGECFEFCDKCAHEYIQQHGWQNKGGTVKGAWDCPDPMGL